MWAVTWVPTGTVLYLHVRVSAAVSVYASCGYTDKRGFTRSLHLRVCLLQVLTKIGERLGDVQVQVPPAGAAAAAAARPPAADVPDIDNLIDAAKYGDLEAVEDFIAIGKVCTSSSTIAQSGAAPSDLRVPLQEHFDSVPLLSGVGSLQQVLLCGRSTWR